MGEGRESNAFPGSGNGLRLALKSDLLAHVAAVR